MRVLQLNSVCGHGSTGRISSDLFEILNSNHHDCLIAFGRGPATHSVNSVKFNFELDVYLHVLKTRVTDKHGFYSTRVTRKLIEIIKKFNPDIIHLHNLHGYYVNIDTLFNYLKTLNTPIVWTLHDCWTFTGHCAHFDYVGCSKWKTSCCKCPQKSAYPSSYKDNSYLNYISKKDLFTSLSNLTIVTPSNWLAGLVKESFLNKYPLRVINNGIDLSLFKPTYGPYRKKYNIDDKFIVLGVASYWNKQKGLDTFCNLAKELDESFIIVLVGNVSTNKLPKNILTLHSISNISELASIYSCADVFVNPTLEDTFPTTNIEALACGTPVITYKTGGSIESIDETCGLVVEKGDWVNLAKSIKLLKTRKNFESSSCILKSKLYNKYDRYNDYLNLYLSLLD